MIVAQNIFGLFDYTVTGEREAEAAAELERRLDAISRAGGAFMGMGARDAVNKIAAEYGVTIRTTLDEAVV